MRAGDLVGQTLREAPSEAEIPSHRLLLRGAFIRRVSAGVYAWLPLGLRVVRRLEAVVRAELDARGAAEVLMPALHPSELWQRSGRWDTVDVLYRLEDSSGRTFCLAPTHEELVTTLAATELPSYKDLPAVLYQVQTKFRDEPRPRGGLLRGREFLMLDAYSFDADDAASDETYARMQDAVRAILERIGLDTVAIEAHPGAMGGSRNHEFTQRSPHGEDTFVVCPSCGYAANTEAATSIPPRPYVFGEAPAEPVRVHTPGCVTVADVAAFLGAEPRQLVKTLLFRAGEALVAAVIPGDRELNVDKLTRALDGASVDMLTDGDFAARGIAKGFSGPVGGPPGRVLVDRSLASASNVVTGANEADHHLTGVVIGRDVAADAFADLVVANAGDRCTRCEGVLSVDRGIEVAHIFQLGPRFAVALDATFTDAGGLRRPYVMGCYGLGISRAVAAVVETHHDERGIAWPRAVAPFDAVVLVPTSDDRTRGAAEQLVGALARAGVDALLDDRAVSAGVKFADADLIGYPLQVVVGKAFASSGRFEVRVRATGERAEVEPTAEAVLGALARCP